MRLFFFYLRAEIAQLRYLSFLIIPLFLSLQGCSSAQKDVNDTIYHLLFESSDVELTDQEIQNLTTPSAYVRIDNELQIVMVLGAFENGEEKWVSQDRTLMVLRHGRVVKTLGWKDNLLSVSNLDLDPLADPQRLVDGARWSYLLTWTEENQVRSGHAESIFHRLEDKPLVIGGKRQHYHFIEETVRIDDLGKSWVNRFWLDPQTGMVVKSEQFMGADYFPIEITILKQRHDEKI
ncbi:YjbF family lipoprotein [Serratia sp. DD3]|uniref:YjbF family lipoprotein n=1 Tax=Serratia sp. DD3 TaxID=1410619 RepID=UPI0004D82C80|nr:YjbF family lipoprotein [Serratia sp. DD3]KEY60040.1 putative lipoprotein GfcB [Serratia sp. DD3]